MNRRKLEALGLTEKQTRAVLQLHGIDVKNRLAEPHKNIELREAITAMLPMIRKASSLNIILADMNYHYYTENQERRKAKLDDSDAAEPIETDDKEGDA